MPENSLLARVPQYWSPLLTWYLVSHILSRHVENLCNYLDPASSIKYYLNNFGISEKASMWLEDSGQHVFGDYCVGTVHVNTMGQLFVWSSYTTQDVRASNKSQEEKVLCCGFRVGDVVSFKLSDDETKPVMIYAIERNFAAESINAGNRGKGVRVAGNTKECVALLTNSDAQRLIGHNPRIVSCEKFNHQNSYETLANILEIKPTPHRWLTYITGSFFITGKFVETLLEVPLH